MEAQQSSFISVPEYLELEAASGRKYEYQDGKVYALAGGSLQHTLIIGNAYAGLRSGLSNAGNDCKPLINDVKVYIEKENRYLYPDTTVVCGPIEESETVKGAILNPIMIIEVLSESTSEYDRGDKFYFYRQIRTLREYLLIAQDRIIVDVFFRKDTNSLWSINRYDKAEQMVRFQSIGLELSVKALYEGVELE